MNYSSGIVIKASIHLEKQNSLTYLIPYVFLFPPLSTLVSCTPKWSFAYPQRHAYHRLGASNLRQDMAEEHESEKEGNGFYPLTVFLTNIVQKLLDRCALSNEER
ncbi:hypothetical protein AVEN_122466-1 [Araneus ventricosus]|uniref:Uncharacterized protein n=1 Tax=Araneus ventricosus TaxID=182803 RepID=A0A4Y2GGI5_ARAVE|nr:hypothetical protein AVEN_244087-1 [Araneus ventricosus]GBM52705.1 hypothetical protein AVEN_54886-1 [Araneus ventricosus]GBM52713.1 hypothetical protein AVEN_55641-1 [Araneus ventricosus]GBM52801.1 hypothetical protein AVEN_122466-1 [Araneus ventricosus]